MEYTVVIDSAKTDKSNIVVTIDTSTIKSGEVSVYTSDQLYAVADCDQDYLNDVSCLFKTSYQFKLSVVFTSFPSVPNLGIGNFEYTTVDPNHFMIKDDCAGIDYTSQPLIRKSTENFEIK